VDTQRDYKAFKELLDQLYAVFRAGAKAPDSFLIAYWNALKDVPFSEVEAHAKRILATATKDTPFPKPRELRNHAPAIEPSDSRRGAAERLNERTWRSLEADDPVRFRIELGIARAARELAQLDANDPGFDEWTQEFRRWVSVRYAPRPEQEHALAKYGGRS
jgi:hypothetical protein